MTPGRSPGGPILVPETDRCPCASNKIARDCCYVGDDVLRAPRDANTRPPGPRTRFRHPKCYAQALGDCSRKLSVEHFVSKSIQERIQGDGLITVVGLPFLRAGEIGSFAAGNLASKVLCRRHNEALSPLDAAASRWFDGFTDLAVRYRTEGPRSEILLFNGHDLERWCLKLLAGGACSGFLRRGETHWRAWVPPERWLRILFGAERMPARWGLYLIPREGHVFEAQDFVLLHPIFGPDGPAAVRLVLSGFTFLFVAADAGATGGTHRLHDIRIRAGGAEKVIAMRWRPEEASPTSLAVTWSPPMGGARGAP